ncbi:fasciclin domain-containing protein [Mucilaginibacter auburnensis]|uniref:Putative surface protein with fasciclin (FAS1) repeats n=1 Tax=Mucilaginibacter auburnensis TaxID=1457233 RepID=A0A2H9VV60_9SPHI|nr:fasciclin domain-containing protein [Mucilaginibacter auburnensis]PJJ84705.1 putative surface protein with fasciclin (FAS1) repeats [Mucilaginibacter auburnensis]
MKVILLSLAFCAIITTGKAQSALLANNTVKTQSANAVKPKADAMDPKKNIPENLSAVNFSEFFLKALKASDLVETFNNTGPLTVFLPVDSAFNKFSKGRLDSLLMPENKYDLIELLTYHALPGNVREKDIAKHIKRGKGKTSFQTIAGAWVTATFNNNGDIILTDERGGKSNIVTSNLKQKNGVVHIVSAVLMPRLQPI